MRLQIVCALLLLTAAQAADTISPSDSRVQIICRVDRSDPAHVRMQYPGVTLRFRFTGDLAAVQITGDSDDGYVTTIVEAGRPQIHRLTKGPKRNRHLHRRARSRSAQCRSREA